jgi:hypothetical protein
MHGRKRISPALVVAVLALFVSLSGTAVAAGVVPLAKRALSADNAKKLGGQTADAIVAKAARTPGPAASAAGLLTVKQASDGITANNSREFVVACDGGRKIVSGGFATDGDVLALNSRPMSDAAWGIELLNVGDGNASVTLYAVCLG